MNILKCIVADDEPIARQIVENYIHQVPQLELIATCKDAFEVMQVLQNETVDILFLDINMPKLSGISLLKTMEKKPNVIITTAYPEFAIEGFELDVVDYLLKPFSLERFLKAVMKVQKTTANQQSTPISAPSTEESNSFIFVKSDKKLIRIDFDDINYIEAYGNYIKIFEKTMVMTPKTLSDFLDQVPQNNFMKVHKSYIVNFNKIKLIDGNQIILHDDTNLPIGKSYRKEVLDRIDN